MVVGLGTLAVRPQAGLSQYTLTLATAAAFVGSAGVTYLLKVLAVVLLSGPHAFADVIVQLTQYSAMSTDHANFASAAVEVARSVGVLVGGMTLLGAM